MKIVVISKNDYENAIKELVVILDNFDITYQIIYDLNYAIYNPDIIVVFGEDKDILEIFHKISKCPIPFLGVSYSKSGFITETSIENSEYAFNRIINDDYVLENTFRLNIKVDNHFLPQALNEAAIFNARSATLLEYTLNVDSEIIWRDYCDGVIISTPIGSTAYSMSAGGPMILRNSSVFNVVSVNSVDVTRRPLILSNDSKILIDDINSIAGSDIIIDGVYRTKVKNYVEINKSNIPLKFIRFPDESKVINQIEKKVILAEELLSISASAKLILKTLQYEGPLTLKDIRLKTLIPDRTIRQSMNVLLKKNLVFKKPFLRDIRKSMYYIVKTL